MIIFCLVTDSQCSQKGKIIVNQQQFLYVRINCIVFNCLAVSLRFQYTTVKRKKGYEINDEIYKDHWHISK